MPESLTITPWPDPVLDTIGYDPRSRYAETFWLPTLGPTALLLLRHLATRFEQHSGSIELPIAQTSHALGLGQRDGASSPIVRTLVRLEQFDLACSDGRSTVAVRRSLPPVQRRHVRRLPSGLQAEHADWSEAQLDEPPIVTARRRARRLALTLLEQGDARDGVEHALFSCGFHPAVCHDAARWAWDRHCEAAREAGLLPAPSP
ncbi:MAG: hypothetical protein AMXMBFR46_10500 [Acidimicrobiia bacterium]